MRSPNLRSSIRPSSAATLILSMGAAFLIAPLARADLPQLGSHSGNVDGYLRFSVGLGLNKF